MKKDNMLTDYQKNSLLEEFQYLVENQAFIHEVELLRKKYNLTIPMSIKYVNDEPIWNVTLETKLKLPEEIRTLAQRCKAYKSKYRKQLLTLLHDYVITGNYQSSFSPNKTDPPRMQILIENGKPVIKIILSLDTGIKEIKELIENNKRVIKKAQKNVYGDRLDISPYLTSNIVLWRLNKKYNKSVDEIIQEIENGKISNVQEDAYERSGLKKIIEKTNSRITDSYS